MADDAAHDTSPHSYGVPPPGFRLPEGTHVGAVRLQVRDLDQSLDYYLRVLGLRVTADTGDTAVLAASDDDAPLVHLHEKPGLQPVPRRGAFGLFHFALLLPDRPSLGRFMTHLAALGISAGSADHLVSEALYLSDPDGLGIEVYADRPRHTWQHTDRQLAMATEALDRRDLAAAGNGRAWEGAPAGTTMGHVHLHVGDLDEARRFYHVGLGLDLTVWAYPGALFMSAGGYHHHVGTNTWSPGPAATDAHARLLEWELVVPARDAAASAAHSLRTEGFATTQDGDAWTAADPWGTRLRLRPA